MLNKVNFPFSALAPFVAFSGLWERGSPRRFLHFRHATVTLKIRAALGGGKRGKREEALQLDKALRVKGPLGPQIQVSIDAEECLTILTKQISSLTPDHQKVRN